MKAFERNPVALVIGPFDLLDNPNDRIAGWVGGRLSFGPGLTIGLSRSKCSQGHQCGC
jgi:hypothetical protein